MFRSWFVSGLLVLAVSILLPTPRGYTDTEVFPAKVVLPPDSIQAVVPSAGPRSLELPIRLPNAAEAPAVHEVAVGLAEPEARVQAILPVRAATPAAVQVAEPSRRLTLEELRRSIHRYPDQDLVDRFWEIATERLPLFGEDD